MRSKPRAPRARARMALIACLLWIASFEVLPWMHIALHEHVGAHHHDAGGSIVRDEADPRSRGLADEGEDDADRHEHEGHPGRSDADRIARVANALTHGRHSLAHHDIAIYAPPPPLTSPLPIDRRVTIVEAATAVDPISLRIPIASARDPPRFDSIV